MTKPSQFIPQQKDRFTSKVVQPMIYISVVVPLYNEKESLHILYDELTKVLRGLELEYEIVFVNDGSTDGSDSLLAALAMDDPRVTVIEFRKNIGKAAALSSGFRHAKGQTIITMDADLQDDPTEIPRFLQKIDEGYDLVSGWKYPRMDPFSKRFPSKVVNVLANLIGGTSLHDMNCGFKAYRREVIEAVNLYGELHRYIPLIVHQSGFKVAEIKVKHHPRKFGQSKYNFPKQVAGSLDLVSVLFLTRFNRKPLHFLGSFGSISFGTGLLISVYLGWIRLVEGHFIGHRPLLLFGMILMVLGVQLFFFGLLAELFIYYHHVDKDEHVRRILQNSELRVEMSNPGKKEVS